MKGLIYLKKILKGIGILFVFLVAIVLTTLTFIWFHPKETWHFVETRFLPADLKITWDHLDIDIAHQKGWQWTLKGEITQLKITKKKPEMSLPVDLVHWNISLDPLGPQKWTIHDIALKSSQTLRFRAGPPAAQAEEKSPFDRLHGYITLLRRSQGFKIHDFDVDMKKFIFTSHEGKETHISAFLSRSSKTPEDVIHFVSRLLLPTQPQAEIATQGFLNLDHFSEKKPFLKAHLDVWGWGVKTRQNILFHSEEKNTLIFSSGRVSYTKGKIKLLVFPVLSLKVSPQNADLQVKADVTGIPGPVVRIRNLQAHAKVPFTTGTLWSDRPSEFSVSAPISLFFVDRNMKIPLEKSCKCRIPEVLQVNLKGQAWLNHLLGRPRQEQRVFDTHLSVESVENRLFTVDLGADLTIHKKADEYYMDPYIDSRIQLHSFRGLRNYLDAKNLLIPAPFNALDGTVDLRAQGPVRTDDSYVPEFPLNAEIRLSSPNQLVQIDSFSRVRLDRTAESADFKVKMSIHDLQLELPPLNPVGGVPHVTPDTRILKKPPVAQNKKARRIKLGFDFEAVTTKPGSIRLLSKYAKPYLPLSIFIGANERKDTTGFIQSEPFAVEYLRRVVHVESWKLSLDEAEKKVLPMQGRFRIDQAEYKIYIHFGGTLQKPNISLTSVPYLPQNQIISVLLYGRPTDQLNSSEADTAGSVAAAMADRAIGIFGMWAFAATPIQSFSYNPITKVYAATLKITDDLSAGIGTNWEEATSVELRKRVSRQWMLTASWTPDEDGEMEEKLVLQWEKRF